jgi:hypothetical protein
MNPDLIPGATGSTCTVDLNSIPPGKIIAVRMLAINPGPNGCNRRGTPFFSGDFNPAATVIPTVTPISPTSAGIGGQVTLTGANFCSAQCSVSNGTGTRASVRWRAVYRGFLRNANLLHLHRSRTRVHACCENR